MSVIADLHIHSRFSRATSKQLTPRHLAAWAQCKGIHILGTGDFTHPQWRTELREQLIFDEESGFYKLNVPHETLDFMQDAPLPKAIEPLFCLQTEISSIYKRGGNHAKSTILSSYLLWRMQTSSRSDWHTSATSPPTAAPSLASTPTIYWRLYWKHLPMRFWCPPTSGPPGSPSLVQNQALTILKSVSAICPRISLRWKQGFPQTLP